MARHEIKFYGSFDGSQIEKQTKRLSQTIENSFGEQGVSIVDKNSISFLKDESGNAVKALQGEIKRLTEETKKFDSEIRKTGQGSKDQNVLAKKRLEITQKIVQRERELATVQKMQNRIAQAQGGVLNRLNPFGGNVIDVTPKARALPGKRQSFLGSAAGVIGRGLGRVGGALPGVGGMASSGMSAAGGMMGAGALGIALGGITAAAGAAVIAITRMATAAEVYSQQIPTFLKLSAMGQNRAGGVARETAIQMGFSAQETFNVQEQLNRALGGTTQRGSEARVANVLTAARQLAVDPMQIAGMGNQLRAVGGTQAASKQLAQILDKAITKGMDASQASHFLEASASLLSQLNETGLMSTDRMMAAMADLALDAGMSAEQSARILGSMSAAIQGSSGEANVFFQAAAARGNLGGGSILGSQEAVRQGLTGLNMEELTRGMTPEMAKRMQGAFGGLGAGAGGQGAYTRSFAGGILEQLNSIAPDVGTDESLLARSRVAADMFGKGTAAEGARILGVLEKLERGQGELTEKEQEMIDSLEKDPEKEWRGAVKNSLSTIALNTASLKAERAFLQTDLGQGSQSLFNNITKALNALDSTLSKIVNSETLKNAFSSIGTSFDAAWESLKKVPDMLSKIWENFNADPMKFGEDMANSFIDLLKGFWDGVLEKLGAIFDAFPGFMKDITGFGAEVGKDVTAFGDKAGSATAGLVGTVMNSLQGNSAGQSEALMQNSLVGRQRGHFARATGGVQLDREAIDDFVALRADFKRTGQVDPEKLKAFNQAQQAGPNFTQSEFLELLRNISQNTAVAAQKRKRVELQGNPRETTAPKL